MNRFDEAATTWDDDPAKLERTRTVAALLCTQLPLTGNERVLDVGAGTGQLSLHLADTVAQVLVSDSSQGMVAAAGRNIVEAGLEDRFTAVQLDLAVQSPLEDASFDGAWSMLALHHVPELDLLLGRVHAALRPGGWLAIVDLERDPDGAFHAHVGDDFHGHHGFDREELRKLLTVAGFDDVRFTAAGAVDRELDSHGSQGGRRSFPMFLAVATRS